MQRLPDRDSRGPGNSRSSRQAFRRSSDDSRTSCLGNLEYLTVYPALKAGTVLEFFYPEDNRLRVKTRFLRRRLLIREVRDIAIQPVEPEYIIRNPDLRRGPILLTGYDWTREDTRSFYPTSMRSISLPEIRVLQLGFYDPLDEVAPPKLFGPLWTDSRAELQQIRKLIRYLTKLGAAKPSTRLAVGVFPVTDDTLAYSQAGMRVIPNRKEDKFR